ncbi:MAG: hypothetical protein U0Q16_16250 [Bryobacteraceae bacterium]
MTTVSGRVTGLLCENAAVRSIRAPANAVTVLNGTVRVVADARGFTPARLELTEPVALAVERSREPNLRGQVVFLP